jgi:hypothetical protein
LEKGLSARDPSSFNPIWFTSVSHSSLIPGLIEQAWVDGIGPGSCNRLYCQSSQDTVMICVCLDGNFPWKQTKDEPPLLLWFTVAYIISLCVSCLYLEPFGEAPRPGFKSKSPVSHRLHSVWLDKSKGLCSRSVLWLKSDPVVKTCRLFTQK